MYKLSKFNYSCFNYKNELLLFNTLKGTESMCKIIDKNNQEKFLNNFKLLDQRIVDKLINKGLIINEDVDEDRKLDSLIQKYMAPKDLSITISPTEGCNFRCKYCYETHENLRMSSETRENIISFVKDNIHKFTDLNINWFGGEPLLMLNEVLDMSEKFIEISKFYRRRYSAAMTTNGYLLDINTFKKLLNARINIFQITIDGIECIHNNQRPLINGNKTFSTIYSNLMEIKKLKNRNFHIMIRSNFTKDVFENLDEYIQLIDRLCSNDSRFSLTLCYAAEWSNNIDTEFKKKFLEDLNSLTPIYELILKQNKKINFVFPLDSENGNCNLGRNDRYFFRPNGEIHKCTVCFENKSNIIGKIINNKVELNDNIYNRMLITNRCGKIYECFYSPICKGEVCPSQRKNKIYCPDGKTNLNYYLMLKDNCSAFEAVD